MSFPISKGKGLTALGMPMFKGLKVVVPSAVVLGVFTSIANAEIRSYEIDGKQYFYSTNNRAQTLEAKRRMDEAKQKAEAQNGKNFLSTIFRGNTEAQPTAEKSQQAAEPRRRERRVSRDERRNARDERPAKARPALVKQASADGASAPLVQMSEATPSPLTTAVAPAVAEPQVLFHKSKKVKLVSFDVESGIKTTVMVDGSTEEEPFDSSMLRNLAPEQSDTNSLTAFVNQLRRLPAALPEEATGSIAPKPSSASTPKQ